MFKVGDYVKYKGVSNSRVGVVVKVNDGYVDVFFKEPIKTIGVLNHLLEKTSWEEFEGKKEKSFEQLIDEMFKKDSIEEYREKQRGMFFDTSYIYGRPERKENKKWLEALKQAYIDMALQTGDKEWFEQLTKDDE